VSSGKTLWKAVTVDQNRAMSLQKEVGLPLPVVMALIGRGFDDCAAIKQYLNPRLSEMSDPFLLPDMMKAVDRIWRAIRDKENILVHGDFDADGVTSTALMLKVIRGLGGSVSAFLPNRVVDGYGLSRKSLERCLSGGRIDLIITVDCGTNALPALQYAASCGVDVVVTDHHEISGPSEPSIAVVNPKAGHNPAVSPLAGVGVAFKVCHALVKYGNSQGSKICSAIDLRAYLDIVATGTVADVVPLTGENRIIVKHGLGVMNKSPNQGLKALITEAGLKAAVDSYHIGFILGPRLNAPGRMGSAEPALELLMDESDERVSALARQLDGINYARKKEEQLIVDEAVAEIDQSFNESNSFGLVTGKRGWHIGIIGIVASSLCGKYGCPAAVIGFNEQGIGRGSCRSVDALDVVEVLRGCSDLLLNYGGHRMAAGFSIEERNLDDFKHRFNCLCGDILGETASDKVKHFDAWLDLRAIDRPLIEAVNMLKPFGLGNPAPVWGARDLDVVGEPRIVGERHLKFTVASGGSQMEAIAFNMGLRNIPRGKIDVLFSLQENTYQGGRTLQLNVKDFVRSSSIVNLPLSG